MVALLAIRARSDEQGFFAKYLHAIVSGFQNKYHLNRFNCLSILRNRYNPMKNHNSRLLGVQLWQRIWRKSLLVRTRPKLPMSQCADSLYLRSDVSGV